MTDGREARLAATLIDLADTLVSDYDLIDYLDRLLERSAGVLGNDAGGVLLHNGDRGAGLELLAWTGELMNVVELFQLQRKEGPCVDSFTRQERVIEPDLGACERWPQFTDLAVRAGYRSVVAFPMRLRGYGIGAMNLFWKEPSHAAGDDLAAVQAFADMATIGILQERTLRQARDMSGQLQSALHSRVIIEQAKGVLAERAGLDMRSAFEVLRRYSRNHNRRLREVAAEVITGALPTKVIISTSRTRDLQSAVGSGDDPSSWR